MRNTEEIGADLATARRELAEAERDLGAAVLDDSKIAAATARQGEARQAIAQHEAALAEADRRADERERDAGAAAGAASRLDVDHWHVAFLERVERVLRIRRDLDAAEEDLQALGAHSRILRLKARLDQVDIRETDLDFELVEGTPDFPQPAVSRLDGGGRLPGDLSPAGGAPFTLERCSALLARAKELLAAEEAGGPSPPPPLSPDLAAQNARLEWRAAARRSEGASS